MAKPRRRKDHRPDRRHDQVTRREPFANDWGEAIFEPPPSSLPGPVLVENNWDLVLDSLPPADVFQDQSRRPPGSPQGAGTPRRHLVNIKYKTPAIAPIAVGDQVAKVKTPFQECAARYRRSEVLHALGRTGRGSKNNNRNRSTTRC